MNKAWIQTLLFISLTVGGCCAFIIAKQIAPWIIAVIFIPLSWLTLSESFQRKTVHLWAFSVICQLAFIFLKVL